MSVPQPRPPEQQQQQPHIYTPRQPYPVHHPPTKPRCPYLCSLPAPSSRILALLPLPLGRPSSSSCRSLPPPCVLQQTPQARDSPPNLPFTATPPSCFSPTTSGLQQAIPRLHLPSSGDSSTPHPSRGLQRGLCSTRPDPVRHRLLLSPPPRVPCPTDSPSSVELHCCSIG